MHTRHMWRPYSDAETRSYRRTLSTSLRNLDKFLPFNILIPQGILVFLSSCFRNETTFHRGISLSVENFYATCRLIAYLSFKIYDDLIASNLAYICSTILIIPTNRFRPLLLMATSLFPSYYMSNTHICICICIHTAVPRREYVLSAKFPSYTQYLPS